MDYSCCSASSPCNQGEGDCDSDSECAEGLKCGLDNCRVFNPSAQVDADCCHEPGEKCMFFFLPKYLKINTLYVAP